MMISLISGAFAPGLALLSFIYLKDKYEPEPLSLIVKLFILGGVLVFPAYVIERVFQEGITNFEIFTKVINIAIIEEFLKWFTLYFIMYKHIEFNEPYDGVVYSVSIAIGFATIENLGFLFFNSVEPTLILLRAFLPVSGHALFAIIMGYFIGQAKFNKNKNRHKLLFLSLAIPIFTHSIYNLILYQTFTEWFYLMIPFLIGLWWYGLRRIKIANASSPLR
ncbi:MAG: glutamic-type intramembrane protease PrsW [Vulcanibacillus sp.]